MRPTLTAAVLGVALLTAGCGRLAPGDVAAVLDDYCAGCHNPTDLDGGFAFADLDAAHVDADAERWEAVVRKLRTRTMPPHAAQRRPDLQSYERLAVWLEDELDSKAVVDPGRSALRRLNRAEYKNAIRELLDLEVDVAALLPPDDSAYGFDNNADVLIVSPALLERYLAAADRVSALAVGDLATAIGAKTYTVPGDHSQALHLAGLPLGTVGGMAVEHDFPLDAEYEFQVTLFRNNLEGIRGLEHDLDSKAVADPGRSALGRLNRGEYKNAIRELLDLEVDVAALLPPDDSAYGFDNNADVLVVSPALLERYLAAADRVSALPVGDLGSPMGATS